MCQCAPTAELARSGRSDAIGLRRRPLASAARGLHLVALRSEQRDHLGAVVALHFHHAVFHRPARAAGGLQRLGKLLEQKLGAEVVYTRDDDTFIPLETRTAIANKHEADLFISVHANSSRDPKARGVETYYLNFTSDSEALDVAARENAVSEKSVFELSDLVKKIALKEKIEESREFASDVQGALFSGLALKNAGLRNRGVKKAPFVVLIGANMPSILAEISFVSNPQDERRLKTPEYRQKIAESLFKGVNKYANGLSGVKNASKLRADAAGGSSGGQ